MISISAQRRRKPAGSRNTPTPERLAKVDAPVKSHGRFRVQADVPIAHDGPIRDPLKHWLARGQISIAQHDAGRRFQRLYERAALGADGQVRGEVPVTRDHACMPPAPASALARSELTALNPILGELDFKLLCNVLGRGKAMDAESPAIADGGAYVARRIRDALNLMAMKDVD